MERRKGFLGTLRSRLIFSMTLICFIPLAVAILISYTNGQRTTRASAEKLNRKQADFIKEEFSNKMTANLRAME